MSKYKVITSQVVYEYAIVEANSEHEAWRLVGRGEVDPQWHFLDYGTWQVDDVEEIQNV